MDQSIRNLLSLLISGFTITLFGCQNRAPSLRMLDTRAGYGADIDENEVALYDRTRNHRDTVALRSAPKVAMVYVYPHELPSRDYFWGGSISLIVSQDEWVFGQPESDAVTKPGIREIKKKK